MAVRIRAGVGMSGFRVQTPCKAFAKQIFCCGELQRCVNPQPVPKSLATVLYEFCDMPIKCSIHSCDFLGVIVGKTLFNH